MRVYHNKVKDLEYFLYRWISTLVDPVRLIKGPYNFVGYIRDLVRYSSFPDSEPIKLINTYPCIYDKIGNTEFNFHYFYQDIWAFKKIYQSKTKYHVDVGSRVDFIGFLTAITNVTFIDIRPLIANLENLESKRGSILSMPYDTNSVTSLSCLHVAEHIGLGRYGDQLDPLGTRNAAKELSRILAPNGNLFFSLPIGKPKLCFNAHRIHSTQQIFNYFSDLELVEFSGIDDKGNLLENIRPEVMDYCDYGCGLFWFRK